MKILSSTLALIKPDALERRLVGEIFGRIERAGFTIAGCRSLIPDDEWNPREFYGRQHKGKPYFEALVAFMESGPSIALVLQHADKDAIAAWRELMGHWDLNLSRVGTIRGDLMRPQDAGMRNLVHGSDSEESFNAEIDYLAAEGVLP